MWVDRKKRCRAKWRTITTSSSVKRNAGGSDARRNRGRRIGATSDCVSMQTLYRAATTAGRKRRIGKTQQPIRGMSRPVAASRGQAGTANLKRGLVADLL